MFKNSEHYADPTAGEAISNVMKEYRKQQKEKWNRQYALKHRKRVYVVSKYAGDIEGNVARARQYCRQVIDAGFMPIASHLHYPEILEDADPTEREMGLMFGLALLKLCDEVWCFVTDDGVSTGMQAEIEEAKRLKKKIKYMEVD